MTIKASEKVCAGGWRQHSNLRSPRVRRSGLCHLPFNFSCECDIMVFILFCVCFCFCFFQVNCLSLYSVLYGFLCLSVLNCHHATRGTRDTCRERVTACQGNRFVCDRHKGTDYESTLAAAVLKKSNTGTAMQKKGSSHE
jgi:hypothetical protein